MTAPSTLVSETKAIVRGRDADQCVLTAESLWTTDGSHDHRKLRSQGGLWTPANVILLSGSGTTKAHGWKHREPTQARLRGFYVPVWEDPARVPLQHIDPLFGLCWALLNDDGSKTYLEEHEAHRQMRELGIWQDGEHLDSTDDQERRAT